LAKIESSDNDREGCDATEVCLAADIKINEPVARLQLYKSPSEKYSLIKLLDYWNN
jgi:hypothetical protein